MLILRPLRHRPLSLSGLPFSQAARQLHPEDPECSVVMDSYCAAHCRFIAASPLFESPVLLPFGRSGRRTVKSNDNNLSKKISESLFMPPRVIYPPRAALPTAHERERDGGSVSLLAHSGRRYKPGDESEYLAIPSAARRLGVVNTCAALVYVQAATAAC